MKIFILEDSDERIRFFQLKFGRHFLHIAKSAYEAYDILIKENVAWDIIFLDHDLGGINVNSKEMFEKNARENNGYNVAKFIAGNNIQYDHAIIHSVNYEGASQMARVLHDAQYIPFFNLKEHLEEYLTHANKNV